MSHQDEVIDLMNENAALKARVAELEGALKRYQDGAHEWRRRAEKAEAALKDQP